MRTHPDIDLMTAKQQTFSNLRVLGCLGGNIWRGGGRLGSLMQVVYFTSLMQVCRQVISSLLALSSCVKSVKTRNSKSLILGMFPAVHFKQTDFMNFYQ